MSKLLQLAVLLMISTVALKAQQHPVPSTDSVKYKVLRVTPSLTNAGIHAWDTTHVVYYDPSVRSNKLLLWLAGTNGTPLRVPVELFHTALAQGYRVIALSYMTVPAVAQVCVGRALDTQPDCAERFRRKRIYGDITFPAIPDEPQDAIIPRFVALLKWLSTNDAAGNWSRYLTPDASKPNWQQIAVSGQSQGGGMAEFIAQQESIARMISFSGGWDYANSREKRIAGWYFKQSATPVAKWFATYNVNENAAKELKEICAALRIPAGQVFALDRPLLNPAAAATSQNPYHGDGIQNLAYRPIWIQMLGSGIN